jgi:hypothetical protein
MNAAVYHLILFVSLLICLTVIIVTGHDSSPLLRQLGGGLFGGAVAGSGVGALPALIKFFAGPASPPTVNGKQTGNTRVPVLISLLIVSIALAACAGLQKATASNPLAVSCATSSAALKVITTARATGHLTPADVQGVDAALAVITPICEAPVEPSGSAAASSALVGAVASLQGIAAHYSAAGG